MVAGYCDIACGSGLLVIATLLVVVGYCDIACVVVGYCDIACGSGLLRHCLW